MNFRTAKWAFRDLYASTRPQPRMLVKPVVIQFPVNDICNSKCQMCHIWERKLDYQLSSQELGQILSSPLFSDVRSVGVNGGEPTLRKDLDLLVDVLFQHLPNLSGISLITNALNSRQAIDRIEAVAAVVRRRQGNLDVMVSLDGVGDIHDIVRGRPGNFDHARRVIDHIKSSNTVTSCRLGATVIHDNVFGLHDLLDFAIENDIYIKFRLGIPHQRLYTSDLTTPYELSDDQIYHFCIFLENVLLFYEHTPLQREFYRSLIDQLAYGKVRAASCSWQHQGVTLTSRGELLYCAVASKTLGDAGIADPNDLYFGHDAHRKEIIDTRCADCTHDYLGLPSTRTLLRGYGYKALAKLHISASGLKQSKLVEPLRRFRKERRFDRRVRSFGLTVEKLGGMTPASWSPSSHSRPFRILICGWYGTETLGDKAILGGVLDALKYALGDIEVHLASLNPFISANTQRQMPELVDVPIHPLDQASEILPWVDLLVFGGGPIMAIDPIADVLDLFRNAALADVPSLIAGCGVGPMGTPRQNEYVAHLLRLATGRIYRDGASMDAAQRLGVDVSRDWIAEDPACLWISTAWRGSVSPTPLSGGPRLLLGLRDWPFREYARDLSYRDCMTIKDHFDCELLAGLTLLVEQVPDLRIVPFPMCTNHLGGDDRWYYRRLLRQAPHLEPFVDKDFLNRELAPKEAIPVFAGARALLGMRFHSLVFARALSVPSVAIDYTLGRGKVSALAQHWGIDAIDLRQFDRMQMIARLAPLLTNEQSQLEPPVLNFRTAMSEFLGSATDA